MKGGARKGAGRHPKLPSLRAAGRCFKATDEEWNAIKSAARSCGLSAGRYIVRMTIDQKK